LVKTDFIFVDALLLGIKLKIKSKLDMLGILSNLSYREDLIG